LPQATRQDAGRLIDCADWEQPVSLSYARLDALANACARGLLRRGLGRGRAVAILSANRAEYLVAYLGAMRAGLVAVPVNHRFPRELIAYIAADANLALVLHDRASIAALPPRCAAVGFDDEGPDGFGALLDPGPFASVRPQPDDPAMVLYTSGSSGRPKGVVLSHAGQLWSVAHRANAGRFADQRLLIAAPLFHMNALGTVKFAFASGASIVLLPRFEAQRYFAAICRFRCTWLTGVPTMFALLLREMPASDGPDLSFVRHVRMGSAPASATLIAAIQARFPSAAIALAYGTTESGPVTFEARGRAKAATALGWPAEGVAVRFATAQQEAAGEGILQLRTPAMMRGYLNLPEATRAVLSPDGWYTTGDIFARAPDGCYSFVGRADDMINCGGENIFPAEVEALLLRHRDIAEAAVVGVTDALKGEKPVAFLVLRPGARLTEQQVKAYVLANAPAFQHPRRVTFLPALPLAGTNKVDRRALSLRAAQQASVVSNGD
jgi:acyl-CoA synthetase (AMP-forming)/AMP-acid ligase II